MLHRIQSFPFDYKEVQVDVIQLFVKENGNIRWENEQTLDQYAKELGAEGVRKQLYYMFRRIDGAKKDIEDKMIKTDQEGHEEVKTKAVKDLFGFFVVPGRKTKQSKDQNIKI